MKKNYLTFKERFLWKRVLLRKKKNFELEFDKNLYQKKEWRVLFEF